MSHASIDNVTTNLSNDNSTANCSTLSVDNIVEDLETIPDNSINHGENTAPSANDNNITQVLLLHHTTHKT